jgi:phage protein U
MTDVLLQLGGFTFAVNDVAPQTIGRSTEYRWAWIDLLGAESAGQFTGPGEDTITLEGVIYPEFASQFFQSFFRADPLERLRDLAAAGLPVPLVDGLGKNHGQWVVLNVSQTSGPFFQAGVARKITFTVSLRKWKSP